MNSVRYVTERLVLWAIEYANIETRYCEIVKSVKVIMFPEL